MLKIKIVFSSYALISSLSLSITQHLFLNDNPPVILQFWRSGGVEFSGAQVARSHMDS